VFSQVMTISVFLWLSQFRYFFGHHNVDILLGYDDLGIFSGHDNLGIFFELVDID
jgi:hypothetical protein